MTSNSRDSSKNHFHQPDVMRQRLAAIRITPESALASGDQLRSRFRVTAGEQSDLVAQPHQFLRQIGNDPFRSAV